MPAAVTYRAPVCAAIREMFEKYGANDYIGEDVSMRAHMVQAAQCAREEYPRDWEIIVAALLHDMGHLIGLEMEAKGEAVGKMDEYGIQDHEGLGRDWVVAHGLSERVGGLIAAHVQAKRYLVTTTDYYYDTLSQASIETLKRQGGRMSAEELAAFEAGGDVEAKVRFRTYDEKAKVLGKGASDAELDEILHILDAALAGEWPLADHAIVEDNTALKLSWSDGHVSIFHAVWLRDNDQSPASKHSGNGQRLFDLMDIPADITVASCARDGTTLHVTFGSASDAGYTFATTFDAFWLREHCYTPRGTAAAVGVEGWAPERVLWNADVLAAHPKTPEYHEYAEACVDNAGVVADFVRFGFALVRGAPTAEGTVLGLPALLGSAVRVTNYGELFEVRVEENPTNLAFTGLPVSPHTDNPYRTPVPSVQILHCLVNDCPLGEGLSGLCDGFYAAELLRKRNPDAFKLLSTYHVPFEWKNDADGVLLRARQPLIESDDTGRVTRVTFNNRSCAPLHSVPPRDVKAYYAAYRAFASILLDPAQQSQRTLRPGDAVLFDNTRLLHSRTGFSTGGARWLQGTYADKDAPISKQMHAAQK